MSALSSWQFQTCFLISILLPLTFYAFKKYLCRQKVVWKKKHNYLLSVGFFHPYCNAGGGGERVLWSGICAIQKRYSNAQCIVYTGDTATSEEILSNVELRFNIKLPRNVHFIYLKTRYLIEAKNYPYFTLLMQSLGSVVLAIEAILKHVPDIYVDTMGYAWSLPIFKQLGSCRVGAYVHYPTISTDMLHAVKTQKIAVNNRKFISNSAFFSRIKLMYYKIYACLYSLMGRQAEIIMVNSTWTRGHIVELWKKADSTFTVYPPCDISEFETVPLEKSNERLRIISIAQFRPEKDHELQIKAFHKFLNHLDSAHNSHLLVLIGSCRHEEDRQRVLSLKRLCNKLNISNKVEFKVNLTFQDIILEMKNANVALHTMMNEHFGIGIVECMSAGLVMIAHDSGGPKLDIVTDFNSKKTGFLATDVDSYAEAMEKVWKLPSAQLYEIRKNAREHVSRFSVSNFENDFVSATTHLFT